MADIGFLGGGQLARMSIQAAQRMGLTCLSLDPAGDSPASQIAPFIVGGLSDPSSIAQIMRQSGVVTLENEFIPAEAIRSAAQLVNFPEDRIIPGIDALATIQDKLRQRTALTRAGVPSPTAVPIETDGTLGEEWTGFPTVLKARFGGYDGKGTRYARNAAEYEALRPLWSAGGWMAEDFVPFRRELAVMVCRYGPHEIVFPTVETIQTNHVCDLVFPANCDASGIALEAVKAMKGEGLFGVELFELESGELLVNEIAPRPHNTGHYTLDWSGPSQFEAHIRAVRGMAPPTMPLYHGGFVMANLLGIPESHDYHRGLAAALEVEGCYVHWYGKSESRSGRKMGHLNVVDQAWHPDLLHRAKEARKRFYSAWIQS